MSNLGEFHAAAGGGAVTSRDTVRGSSGTASNRVLAALDVAALRRVEPDLKPVWLAPKQVVFESGESVLSVHFPIDGAVSLLAPLEDGATVEVASIGCEGIVGVPFAPGPALGIRAVCLGAVRAMCMPAAAFECAVDLEAGLRRPVRDYQRALFGQLALGAACARLHSSEERVARWVLTAADRTGHDTVEVTHESLAQCLGARRATITLAAGALQTAGLIRYRRGTLAIVDREGLESLACECYTAMAALAGRDGAAVPLRPVIARG